ncbi:ABC transporter substrate-binding protein [Oceanicoccus sp. KOV_DT_Chl]|uniref:substrate-binding periplasmic protein n=1 Tax=Oceanicoccus sp. KOV_DT_Chl TaxID=1904639 RepID=UPI000C7E2686|nr:transporter substrate-binding domain-containing protein [Oceanicoccus sp. KOV_DT_Chl]
MPAYIALLLVTIIFTPQTWAAPCEKTLRIAWEPFSPYLVNNADGSMTGVDAAVVEQVLKEMQCSISWHYMPWQRTLIEIAKGSIDIAAAASKTAARQEWMYYSDVYRNENIALFVRKNETANIEINQLIDIKDIPFRLGLVSGSYFGKTLETALKNQDFQSKITWVVNTDQLPKMLHAQWIDGFITHKAVGYDLNNKHNSSSEIDVYPIEISNDPLYYIFSKKSISPQFVDEFNRTLQAMKTDASYQQLLAE